MGSWYLQIKIKTYTVFYIKFINIKLYVNDVVWFPNVTYNLHTCSNESLIYLHTNLFIYIIHTTSVNNITVYNIFHCK